MSRTLKSKDYWRIFLLYGIVYATIPIIIMEITWDSLIRSIGLNEGLLKELIESFFRAALIEESFKFFGFMRANKEYKFSNEKEYMLGAGMIGLAYGIIEKVASGNAMAIILGIIFPMHIIWQMNQGRHFYKYKKAKEENDNKTAKKELFLATFVIFLIHGCWDALISLIGYFADTSKIVNADTIGSILLVIVLLFGLIYMIVSIVKIRKVLKNYKALPNEKNK
ncbi:MAG: PrsW family intramembrane metalloprotease [Bacilli bacterium]|nr:PrsW family intramembrane metalloprotease [Bacilli bacterium]